MMTLTKDGFDLDAASFKVLTEIITILRPLPQDERNRIINTICAFYDLDLRRGTKNE